MARYGCRSSASDRASALANSLAYSRLPRGFFANIAAALGIACRPTGGRGCARPPALRNQNSTRSPSDKFLPPLNAKCLMRLVASRYFSSSKLSARNVIELTRPPAVNV